jgi:hypothetical protein
VIGRKLCQTNRIMTSPMQMQRTDTGRWPKALKCGDRKAEICLFSSSAVGQTVEASSATVWRPTRPIAAKHAGRQQRHIAVCRNVSTRHSSDFIIKIPQRPSNFCGQQLLSTLECWNSQYINYPKDIDVILWIVCYSTSLVSEMPI